MAVETVSFPPYRQFLPTPPLRPWVLCFWAVHAPALETGPRRIRVLPDGCLDVIFNFGGPMGPEGASPPQPRAFVVGASMRPGVVEMHGRVDVTGIRLRPGGASALLGLSCAELSEDIGPVELLGGGFGPLLRAHAGSEPDPARRVTLLERLLLERTGHMPATDPAIARALAALRSDNGSGSTATLADNVGLGRRRLERLFARHVGVAPAQFGRTLRLHRALALLRGSGCSLTDTALIAGFCDQPHLNRELRSLTGLTPLQLRTEWRDVATVQYAAQEF